MFCFSCVSRSLRLARLGVDKQGERREIKARVLKIFAIWKKTNPGGHMGHNKDPTFHTIGGAGRKEGRGEG